MERPVVGADERPADVGELIGATVADSPSMASGEGEGDLGRRAAVGAIQTKLPGDRAAERIEGTEGGERTRKHLAEAPIDEQSVVLEEGGEGGGEGSVGEREASDEGHLSRPRAGRRRTEPGR